MSKTLSLERLPNPLSVGKYFLFVRNYTKEDFRILEHKIDPTIEQVIVEGDVCELPKISSNVSVKFVSEEEFLAAKNIKIPNWVCHLPNLENILKGDYHAIRPVTAEFVSTLNCNFRCVQCSYTEPKKAKNVWLKEESSVPSFQANNSKATNMTPDVMEITLDRLAEGGVRNILFTGGGEPLITPITLEGMRRASLNGNVIALYTNGRFLDAQTSQHLLELEPLFVRVSVYGGNTESSQQYTQAFSDKASYQKVIQHLKEFSKIKKELQSSTNFGLSYLVHPLTINSIKDFVKDILKLEIGESLDYIRFTPAVDYFFGRQHDQTIIEQAFKNIEEHYVDALEEQGIKVKLYYHRVSDLNKKKTYDTCRASGWFVEVAPSGEVFLCCEKHFISEYRIGDLTSQTLEEIWNSDLRRNVIDRVNSSHCGDCPTLCKPHELNKVFNLIEELRFDEPISVVDRWTKDLIAYGKISTYCPGRLDDFQS